MIPKQVQTHCFWRRNITFCCVRLISLATPVKIWILPSFPYKHFPDFSSFEVRRRVVTCCICQLWRDSARCELLCCSHFSLLQCRNFPKFPVILIVERQKKVDGCSAAEVSHKCWETPFGCIWRGIFRTYKCPSVPKPALARKSDARNFFKLSTWFPLQKASLFLFICFALFCTLKLVPKAVRVFILGTIKCFRL